MASVGGIEQLDPLEGQQAVLAGALLVDVREADEWARARVPGAVHHPMSGLTAAVESLPKDQLIVLLCHSGGRSQAVAQWLRPQGFQVANVQGGLAAWHHAGLPLEP